MVGERQSIATALGIPDGFGAILLAIPLVLCIAAFFAPLAGHDFGLIRVPDLSPEARRKLRVVGPVAFLCAVLIYVPILPLSRLSPVAGTPPPQTPPLEEQPAVAARDDEHYVAITDATGSVRVEVPEEWSNRAASGWTTDQYPPLRDRIGPGLNASTDVAAWGSDPRVPGMFLGVSRSITEHYDPGELLAATTFSSCRKGPRMTIENGFSQTWTNCDGSATAWFQQAQWTRDQSAIVLIQVKIVEEHDLVARDHILRTYEILKLPPG